MTAARRRVRRAVFLDRDGTLVEETDYLSDPDDLVMIDGAVEALRRLRADGWALVIVTNQSGIARGLYGEADYRRVAGRLDALLREAGVAVDATLHCPHHPDFTGPCACRKPAPGMLHAAAGALDLDLRGSVTVGDKVTDVEAGRASGGGAILVRTGYGRRAEAEGALRPGVPVVDSIVQAADRIIGRDSVDPPPGRG